MKKLFVTIKKYNKVCKKAEKYREKVVELLEKNRKLYVSLDSPNQDINELKQQIEILKEQLAESELNYKELLISCEKNNKNVNEKIQDITTEFQESIIEYVPLLNAMKKSRVFEELLLEYGIETDTQDAEFENVIGFVRMIGNGFTFADIMYMYLEQKNSILTPVEKIVIDRLNEFYKEMYDIKYDIAVFPDKDDNNRFDKKIMKDCIKRNDIFMFFSEVYVPAIMRDQNSVEKRAIVKGFN